MGVKFDGKTLKDGSKTIANITNDKQIREGSSTGGKVLANVTGGKQLREGSSTGGTVIANFSSYVREGSSSGGSKANSFDGFDSSAISWALWYLFCK